MKTIVKLIIFSVLFCGFSNVSKAQEVDNPQEAFANKEWYLTKIIIDEEEHLFIPNEMINQSPLYTDELEVQNGKIKSGVVIRYCEECGAEIEFENHYQFKRNYFTCLAYDYCYFSGPLYEEAINYHILYFYDFWKEDEAPETLLYNFLISEHDNHLTLVIINDDGDQAFYGDMPLSVNVEVKDEIKIYPNPVSDHLYIENITENVQLEIYDLSGRKLLNQELNNSSESVNVSKLSEGIYFYGLSQNGKKIKTGKLVKEVTGN